MNVLKETQSTTRASRRPCEYNYTNADIHSHSVQPSEGYQFKYPVNWTGYPSNHKVIGLRRISYKPTSVNLSFNIVVYDCVSNADANDILLTFSYVFTSDNTFEECLARIVADIKESFSQVANSNVLVIATYDKNTGEFNLSFQPNASGTTTKYRFEMHFLHSNTEDHYNCTDEDFKDPAKIFYKSELLKLFNQEITKENVDKLHSFNGTDLHFSNVWNRDTFYCHASFSDSPRQIIGINHDLWPTPSVLYDYSDNSNDFNIYFTTDTTHRILPRNGVLLIQISYIFNYQNSMLHYM